MKRKTKKTIRQSDLNWVFQNEYLGNDLMYKQALKFNQKKHRICVEKISYRKINYWSSNNLISDNRPFGRGWRKFSYSEIVWIMIMKELRKFNFSLDKIKKVKDSLAKYKDPKGISDMPYLDFFSLYVLHTQNPISIYIFSDGEAEISNTPIMILNKQITSIPSYIEIDLNNLIYMLCPSLKSKANNLFMAQFTEEELSVLEKLKDDKLNSLTIEMKDGRPYQIKSTRKKHKKDDLDTNYEYGRTTAIKHEGKIISYLETITERI